MSRGHILILAIVLILVTFALHTFSTLLSLLVEDAALDVVHSSELPAFSSAIDSFIPQLIPKIIHQTYINTSVPERWRQAQQSCISLHPDYEYKFWTDEDNLLFIEKEYPWFLDTFINYAHNIQRVDAVRYFILAHYGGVYLDLDNGCQRRMDPLLQFPAWVHTTDPTGISNDGMGATPGHPFFLFVTEQLQGYDRTWILPYITIMASTGPLFLSMVWERYMFEHLREDAEWAGRVRVLKPDQYSDLDSAFFAFYGGSSWHGGDVRFFLWVGQHWLLAVLVGLSIATFVAIAICRASARMSRQKRGSGDYAIVDGGSSPRRELPGRGFLSRLWLMRSGRDRKSEYEFLEHQVP